MANIRISPENLHIRADSLRSSASNLLSELTRIRQDVSVLAAGWESKGTLAIYDSIFAKAENVEALADMLVNLAEETDAAAESMEQADRMIATSFLAF